MTDEEKRAYARGYNRGLHRMWPAHKPPEPPNEIIAGLLLALRERGEKNMPTDQQYEEQLQELLGFIEGKTGFFAPGITSYTTDERRHKLIHDGCLELERRGKIVRHLEGEGFVVWKPKEE